MNVEIKGDIPRAYRRIFEVFLPKWGRLFLVRAADYQESFLVLGSRGQFSDINRKFWKLKRAVWDGEKLVGEQPEEIVRDLIGHCFLLLECFENEKMIASVEEAGRVGDRLKESMGT